MDIRKNFTELSSGELTDLGAAFNAVNTDGTITEYADLHENYFMNGIHWGPAFLPWHRDFLRKMEIHLQSKVAGVTLPYWDWTQENSKDIDVEPWKSFFGGRPNSGGKFDSWSYGRLASPPASVALPTTVMVDGELTANSFTNFRAIETGSHVNPHRWVGDTMGSRDSPADPIFYLHHCNIDRIWAIWQGQNPNAEQYSMTGGGGNVQAARVPLTGPMVAVDGISATPESMLDHLAVGFEYDDLLAPNLVGSYECHKYDGTPTKNDWHYVTITQVDAKTFQWTNRAGVSWSLTIDKSALDVGQECPYYNFDDGTSQTQYTRAEIVWSGNNITGLLGPWDEAYDKA